MVRITIPEVATSELGMSESDYTLRSQLDVSHSWWRQFSVFWVLVLVFFFFSFFLKELFMCVCVHMYVCTAHECSAHGGQQRALDCL